MEALVEQHRCARYGGCLMAVVIAASGMVVTEEDRAEPSHRLRPVIDAVHHPKPVIAAATSEERKEHDNHPEERPYTGAVVPMGSIVVTGSPTPSHDLGDFEEWLAWHIRSRASMRSPARQVASVFEVRHSKDHLFAKIHPVPKSLPRPEQRKKLLYGLRRSQR